MVLLLSAFLVFVFDFMHLFLISSILEVILRIYYLVIIFFFSRRKEEGKGWIDVRVAKGYLISPDWAFIWLSLLRMGVWVCYCNLCDRPISILYFVNKIIITVKIIISFTHLINYFSTINLSRIEFIICELFIVAIPYLDFIRKWALFNFYRSLKLLLTIFSSWLVDEAL